MKSRLGTLEKKDKETKDKINDLVSKINDLTIKLEKL
jgi:flagellar hook-associated protein FlgK